MAKPFSPAPEYVQAVYSDELRLARERIIYLSACLRQVQAEANAEIARLTTEIARRDLPKE